MTTVCCAQSVTQSNATTFAATIMQIMLRHGICHTLIIDKDSKLYGTFAETCELLNINMHTLSCGNHAAVLFERVGKS